MPNDLIGSMVGLGQGVRLNGIVKYVYLWYHNVDNQTYIFKNRIYNFPFSLLKNI